MLSRHDLEFQKFTIDKDGKIAIRCIGMETIKFEQGTGYQDDTYLYIVFGVDDDWEAVRFTRDLQEKKTTGPHQTGPKPTTLEEVQSLDYLYDYS